MNYDSLMFVQGLAAGLILALYVWIWSKRK